VEVPKLFFENWDPYFDLSIKDIDDKDEKEYYALIPKVQEEITSNNTITRETFERIYKWKTRNRSKHWIEKKVSNYNSFLKNFINDITNVLKIPEKEKIAKLLRTGIKIPIASTYLHFIYNNVLSVEMALEGYPIIDVNTVETIWDKFALLKEFKSKNWILTHTEGYNSYRELIIKINRKYEDLNLRQIDRAFFNYNVKKTEFLRLITKDKGLDHKDIMSQLNIKEKILNELIKDSVNHLKKDLKLIKKKKDEILKKKEEIEKNLYFIQNLK